MSLEHEMRILSLRLREKYDLDSVVVLSSRARTPSVPTR